MTRNLFKLNEILINRNLSVFTPVSSYKETYKLILMSGYSLPSCVYYVLLTSVAIYR